MSESHVVTVVPNINNSFKLAVFRFTCRFDDAGPRYRRFRQTWYDAKNDPGKALDHDERGQDQTLNYEIARDDFLTPLLLSITMYNSLIAQGASDRRFNNRDKR
jgi:hypothetical protein